MAEPRNFLVGKGERLTESIIVDHGGGPRIPPYTLQDAQSRLLPMVQAAVEAFDSLPAAACPRDQVVGKLTLHPEYLAKTAYPSGLLRAVDLRLVGSRSRIVIPEKRSRGRKIQEMLTTELFVAGRRKAFRDWSSSLKNLNSESPGADQLAAIEQFAALLPREKIKPIRSKDVELFFEVVLHSSENRSDAYILDAFRSFLLQLELMPDLDRRIHAGGLCFVPLKSNRAKLRVASQFAFIRTIREMPKLRLLQPAIKATTLPGATVALPTLPPMDPGIRAAIFDGGLPLKTPLSLWAKTVDAQGLRSPTIELLEHGSQVTSAALFGHITPGISPSTPFAKIDHYRVLDNAPGQNPLELYDVLARILAVLENETYDFVNLSIGPELPVDDDDIHPWTAALDEHLAESETLATIAAGNGGERDDANQFNRVQVPADCVNALSIGSCDSRGAKWKRAPYSSIGPGRSPGVVKPDLVAFGGSIAEPFLVVGANPLPGLIPTGGTSFAAPGVMRIGMGIRAHFGNSLRALAIRALIIHAAESSQLPRKEIGWGRAPQDIEDIVVCPPGTIRVVYQGEISAAKYQRTRIPIPEAPLPGKVRITATMCFATSVDPHHPSSYTQSGLEVVFRPHEDHIDPKSGNPRSVTFFAPSNLYLTEQELRRDAHKWENCLHYSKSMLGRSLKNPVFDLHYNAREGGHDTRHSDKLKYALVIAIECPNVRDIYDQVIRRYRTILEPLNPVIEIPVRT